MEKVSDCCTAGAWLNNEDLGLCANCLEHCEFINLEDE
jgi:hypothetical protein